MEQRNKYLSPDEVMEMMEKLSLSDYKRLLRLGSQFCGMYHLGNEAESLLQDALLRIWEGTRHVPRDVHFVSAIGKILWSIAGDHKDKKFSKNESVYESPEDHITESSIGTELSPCPTDLIVAEETVLRIGKFFEGDAYVNALIQAYAANMKQQEIITAIFQGDRKTFEAARRRFRRGMSKIKEEGAGND